MLQHEFILINLVHYETLAPNLRPRHYQNSEIADMCSIQFKIQGGYLSRQVIIRYDVSLLKAQIEVWISMKSVDLM